MRIYKLLSLIFLLLFQFCGDQEKKPSVTTQPPAVADNVINPNRHNNNNNHKTPNHTPTFTKSELGHTEKFIYHNVEGNMISHPIMGMAWKALSDRYTNGENLDLFYKERPYKNFSVDPYVDILNKQKNNLKLNSKNIYSNAGMKRDGIVKTINNDLKSLFPNRSLPPLSDSLLQYPESILAYAYFFLDVQFKEKFESKDIKFIDKKMKGIYNEGYSPSLSILEDSRFKNPKDPDPNFLIRLNVKQDDFILVGGMGKHYDTPDKLQKSIKKLNLSNNLAGQCFKNESQFHMPQLDFYLKKLSYTPLVGKKFTNKSLKSYYISKILDNIKFKLNEEGVKVEIESIIAMDKCAMPSFKEKPLHYIFNKPYCIGIFDSKSKDLVFYANIKNNKFMIKP